MVRHGAAPAARILAYRSVTAISMHTVPPRALRCTFVFCEHSACQVLRGTCPCLQHRIPQHHSNRNMCNPLTLCVRRGSSAGGVQEAAGGIANDFEVHCTCSSARNASTVRQDSPGELHDRSMDGLLQPRVRERAGAAGCCCLSR